MNQPISYQLHIELAQPVTVTIGRLGRFRIPAGHYINTGRARRNLDASLLPTDAAIARLPGFQSPASK